MTQSQLLIKCIGYKQKMTEENTVSLADSRLQPLQFPQHVLKIIMDFRKISLLRDSQPNKTPKQRKKPNQQQNKQKTIPPYTPSPPQKTPKQTNKHWREPRSCHRSESKIVKCKAATFFLQLRVFGQ